MLRVSNLCKWFGTKGAVRDISFHIPAGGIAVLLGPNGAGKTTALRLIMGLLSRDKGQVIVNGTDVAQNPHVLYHDVGYVPDAPNLYSHLTGLEFLSFVAELRKLPDPKTRAESMLQEYGLTKDAKNMIGGYSLGMKKRIMLAAALLHNPKMLILDEPSSGLDPIGMRFLQDVFTSVAARGGAVLMSTHLLAAAAEIATHVVIIDGGQVRLQSTLQELARHGETLESAFMEACAAEGRHHR